MALILVVDREEDPSRILADALESEGHQVERVSDTAAALECLHLRTPKVTVVDLMEEDPQEPTALTEGVKLLAQAYLDHPEIPLIVYTDCRSFREHFWSWVAASYLLKEEGPQPVVEVVERLLGDATA